MVFTGLVSVTFRTLGPGEIIQFVIEAGLDGIEWGGDIHVPHGDMEKALDVHRRTLDAGLNIASYGSYYYTGCRSGSNPAFESVLETACRLGAPNIRVWAGNRGSYESDAEWYDGVVNDARRIAELAAKAGISTAFEFHSGTLTDTADSAWRLIQDINHDNMRLYWQPPEDADKNTRIEGLKTILPWLSNVHVFYWKNGNRMPLSEGADEWREYMEAIKSEMNKHFCMLEFVKDDNPRQFMEDASVLRRIVQML